MSTQSQNVAAYLKKKRKKEEKNKRKYCFMEKLPRIKSF
jgi:hypothetical protein